MSIFESAFTEDEQKKYIDSYTVMRRNLHDRSGMIGNTIYPTLFNIPIIINNDIEFPLVF